MGADLSLIPRAILSLITRLPAVASAQEGPPRSTASRAWGIRMVTRHCYFVPVLRTVLGRVLDLSSFRPPDQYLFLPTSCYHSSMNTASSPNSSPTCSQPSAVNQACPCTPFRRKCLALNSQLSTLDCFLIGNQNRVK